MVGTNFAINISVWILLTPKCSVPFTMRIRTEILNWNNNKIYIWRIIGVPFEWQTNLEKGKHPATNTTQPNEMKGRINCLAAHIQESPILDHINKSVNSHQINSSFLYIKPQNIQQLVRIKYDFRRARHKLENSLRTINWHCFFVL